MVRNVPFLACVHHVQWLTRAAGSRFQCSYCRAFLQRKDLYPKWDDLGPDFQAWWTAHESNAPSVPVAPEDGGASGKPPSQTDSSLGAPRNDPVKT